MELTLNRGQARVDVAKLCNPVHLFRIGDSFYCLDVNTASFFDIDQLGYEILSRTAAGMPKERITAEIASSYLSADITKRFAEVDELVGNGLLFAAPPRVHHAELSPLQMVCLNVSHSCNLRCIYCFANRPGYNWEGSLMTSDVAHRSVDFLLKNCGANHELSISFFGGEPLLNLPVIKETVHYAEQRAKESGRHIRFHLTTNGTIMNDQIVDFLNQNRFSLIVSLDGGKVTQDRQRPFANGMGSYDVVSRNIRKLLSNRRGIRQMVVRSTYVEDFRGLADIAFSLLDIGADYVSVEPAYCESENLCISLPNLNELRQSYGALADRYLEALCSDAEFTIFNFKHLMDHVRHKHIEYTQCGAANGYVAIAPDGKIYPCHRFVGQAEYCLGDVYTGSRREDIRKMFARAHVESKPKCMTCWARYICGGGCHALALLYNHDILQPCEMECELTKVRIEIAAHLYTELMKRSPENYRRIYGPKGEEPRSRAK